MRTVLQMQSVILEPAWFHALPIKTVRRACHAYLVVVVAPPHASMVYALTQDLTAAIATDVHAEHATAQVNAVRAPRASMVYV